MLCPNNEILVISCDSGKVRIACCPRQLVWYMLNRGYSLRSIHIAATYYNKEESEYFDGLNKMIRRAKRYYSEAMKFKKYPVWFNKVKVLCECNYQRILKSIERAKLRELSNENK